MRDTRILGYRIFDFGLISFRVLQQTFLAQLIHLQKKNYKSLIKVHITQKEP